MCGPVSRRRRWATAVTAFSPPRSTRSNSGPLISAVSTSSRPRRVRASCCGSRDSAVTFAALCGVSPVEPSSGKTQRRRLNRGGDRQANCALYTIVLARLRWDARTRAYLERRVTEGKTRREAIRCLKRYVAREIYQTIIIPRKNVLTPASTG